MSIELKPCPACGGVGSLWTQDEAKTLYGVCTDCGLRTSYFLTAEEAISAWESIPRREDADELVWALEGCARLMSNCNCQMFSVSPTTLANTQAALENWKNLNK